jgi:hypothetical protein
MKPVSGITTEKQAHEDSNKNNTNVKITNLNGLDHADRIMKHIIITLHRIYQVHFPTLPVRPWYLSIPLSLPLHDRPPCRRKNYGRTNNIFSSHWKLPMATTTTQILPKHPVKILPKPPRPTSTIHRVQEEEEENHQQQSR